MKKIPLLSLLSLLLFYSMACNKSDDPSAFRIIDAATKEGVPNATVELHESVGGTIATSGTAVFRERTTTNDLGEYQFDYDVKDGTLFSISAGADRYWNSTLNSYRNNKTLELDPEGYVKVKVRKVDTTEHATININTSSLGINFRGVIIDTSYIDISVGNRNINYAWSIYSNGESSTVIGEEFYVPPPRYHHF